MSELTDDQLDGLFRKSAEEFQPPFDSAAWQDMNARLDANDPLLPTSGVSPVQRNILRWSSLFVLLVVGGWCVYQAGKSAAPATKHSLAQRPAMTMALADKVARAGVANRFNNKAGVNMNSIRRPDQAQADNGPVAGLEKVTPDRSRSENPSKATTSGVATEGVVRGKGSPVKFVEQEKSGHKSSLSVSVGEKKRLSRLPRDKSPANISLSMAATTQPATGRSVRRRKQQASNSFNDIELENTSVSDVLAEQNRTGLLKGRPTADKQRETKAWDKSRSGGVTSNENNLPAEADESATVSLPALGELAILPAKWTHMEPSISRSVAVKTSTESTTESITIAPQLVPIRGLSVRFMVAPDLSSVGLKNFSRPGTNVGLLLEYRIASRWSIQAGLIQSTKVYKALTSEYEVPAGWWKAPMKMPESVDGRCTMFDIPINIRYDVVIKPHLDGQLPTRWFVSGGATSYIMKNEEYYYTYPPHTYNQPTEYDVSTGGYGFSNLNLSVGYERSISRRLSWQVEPFMKVPLKGVGNFKVRLLSTGTFFSLRYKL